MDKKKLKEYRDTLVEKAAEITRGFERAKQTSTDDGSGSEDFVDYAVNSYTKEFLLSLSDIDRKALQQVEEALARIRRDEYGICVECGKVIGEKRLQAVAWTACCITCQERLEQESSRQTAGAQTRYQYD